MTDVAERLREAKARDEAAAEVEQPDEETEAEVEETETPQPEPEPEPEHPAQPVGLDPEQAGELEKATTAYYRRVAKAMGGELPMECPACGGLGFDLSGGQAPPDYQHASDKATCDECDGLGGVLSGSKVPGSEVVRCERCKGAGYLVTRPVHVENVEQVAPVVVALAEGNADGGQAAALKPGEPGWEPWMGGGETAP